MVVVKSHTPKGARQRELILARAEAVFADHGFHAASMRDLAEAAGLPLATLVYHFARKEQLYAAVLRAIAAQLDGTDATFANLIDRFVDWAIAEPQRVRLLLREVLDNPLRVARAEHLPLATFLARATELATTAKPGIAPELAVLQLVGAVSYVVAARPTVDRIVGKPRAKELAAAFRKDARRFARRAVGIDHAA